MTCSDPLETPEGQRIALNTIRSAAEGATPGPWKHDGSGAIYTEAPESLGDFIVSDAEGADATYIATMDPQTTLALLDRLDLAESAIGSARGMLVILQDEKGAAEARAENAEQERDAAVHRSGLLAGALGRLLVALGAVTDSPMTGPELLMHAEAAIEHFRDGRHEALAWYADLGNYVSADSTPPAIRSDNGYRARCALGYEGHPRGT